MVVTRTAAPRLLLLGSTALLALALACGGSDDSGPEDATDGSAGTGGTGTSGTGGDAASGSGGDAASGTGGDGASGGGSAGSQATGGGTAEGGSPGSGASGGVEPGTPLKGLAYSDPWQGEFDCEDLNVLNLSWFYNWNTGTQCNVAAQYIPHISRSWERVDWIAPPSEVEAAGHDTVLGFNEPDMGEQANLSVDEALRLWVQMDQTSMRLGSPAVANSGTEWMEAFMQGAEQQGLRVDFVAIHWYGWEPGSCESIDQLEHHIEWAEQFGRPIWLTEWSCRVQSEEVTRAFYNDAVDMFTRHPLFERYAWFLSRSTGDFANAALIDGSGNLTTLGSDYAAAPAYH